jgi:signal transduction histidine kinase
VRGKERYDQIQEARTGPAFGAVPRELVGREVSVRALIPVWEAVREKHLDPAQLAIGTGVSLAQLTDPRERVSWAAFVRFMTNLGGLFDDAELVALGAAILEAPLLRALLLPGRLLFGVSDIYRWAFSASGPASQLFVTHEGQIAELAPGHLRLETRMKPGYPISRENYLVLRGSLTALSSALGAGPAEVTQHDIEGGAIYDIRVPRYRGAFGFVRKQLAWMSAARSNAEELRRAHAELHERYGELQRQIAARIQVEAELRRLNDQLEQRVAERTAALELANAELASFSYSVSHDLQAPLRSMSSFSQALLEDCGDQLDEHAQDYLARIRAAAVRMGELTDGLLQLARVTSTQLHSETIDLSAAARAVIDELARIEPERRVEVSIAEAMTAQGDGRLIRVVLQNLIGNAWKFTRDADPARITIGASRDRDPVTYFVRDNGAGFDMQHAQRLFEPFHRLHRADEFPGSGIGLATVHRILLRHGGRIWAEGAPRGGATFSFTLTGPAHEP